MKVREISPVERVLVVATLAFGAGTVITQTSVLLNKDLPQVVVLLAYGLFLFSGIALMLRYSSLVRDKRYFPPLLIGVAFFGIGYIGMQYEWPNYDYLLILGVGGVTTIYGLRFLNKKRKGLLDLLKVIWVTSFSMSALYFVKEWEDDGLVLVLSEVSYIVMIAVFLLLWRKVSMMQ